MLSVNSPWFSFSSVCEPVFFKPFEFLGGNGYDLLQHLSPPLSPASSLLLPQLGVCSHYSVPCSSSSEKGSKDADPNNGVQEKGRSAALDLQMCVFHFIFQLGLSRNALQHPAKSIFLLQPVWRISLLCSTADPSPRLKLCSVCR